MEVGIIAQVAQKVFFDCHNFAKITYVYYKSIKVMYIKFGTNVQQFSLTECHNTLNWSDNHGNDCESYARYICTNGTIGLGYQGGSKYNYPENNCCSCGYVF